jgi:tRNA A-37 threonylcarbamoyl transferase component Bud32
VRTIGRYELVRKIGSGGMATVYLARQLGLERMVALKELRTLRTPDPSFARRFLREARLAGSLNHPNIVTVHDYFEESGAPHIAMEYLERGSLRGAMVGLTLAQVGGILEDVLAGLAHAERRRIVHRDIKPENLLVSVEGRIKIADFGIAKATDALEEGTLVTRVGLTVGTPNYIAPEQAMAGELGPWSDLYSLGITTFEVLTGRTPFGDTEDPMAIALRQVNDPVPPVSDVVPQVPPWLSGWVGWLVMKDPAQRPQSAVHAWGALEELLIANLGPRWTRGAGIDAGDVLPSQPAADPQLAPTAAPRAARAPTPAGEPPASRPSRRFPTWLKLSAAVAVVLATSLVAFAGRPGGQSPTVDSSAREPVAAPTRSVTTPDPPAVTNAAPASQTKTSTLAGRVAPAQTRARNADGAADAIADGPGGTGGSQAAEVAALREAAQAYRDAAAAAARNDAAAYRAAMTEAAAAESAASGHRKSIRRSATTAVSKPKTATPPATTTTASRPSAPPPAETTPGATVSPGPCSGDSTSDDPSDDSCSEEP